MDMEILFPGNKKVVAVYDGFRMETDQSPQEGGEGSAPEPFSLFLASIGTCAGAYVLFFCKERGIATEGIQMRLSFEWNEAEHHLERIRIDLHLPDGFPAKYEAAVRRAAQLCTVKRHLEKPPAIEITTRKGPSA